jgi:hypothetical protein
MKAKSSIVLTGPQRVQLAALIWKSEKTIVRAYRGEPCSDQSLEAIRRGAARLGFPLPPDPQPKAA